MQLTDTDKQIDLLERIEFRKSTSDATEYAWFVWGPGRGNRWWIL